MGQHRIAAVSFVFVSLWVFAVCCPCWGSPESSISDEGVQILSKYLAINTTNPPGNEMETAKFLKEILDREGIENQIFDLGNNRANLLAVLHGDGTKRPVVLLHHMDVVPADGNYWKIPPFSGKIVNGEIYGRGAVDIKGKGIIDLMAIISLKRKNIPLSRDILYLAVAGEEVDSLGAKWMLENKTDLLKRAEFLVDEGEAIFRNPDGQIRRYPVSIGEKFYLWLTLTFTGLPGHASTPMENSAVNKLIRAANKILDRNKNFIICPELLEFIQMNLEEKEIKSIPGFEKDLVTSLNNQRFLQEISKDPEIGASIQNTISITCLNGSNKINTIPNEASMGLDCRLLPGSDPKTFIASLQSIIDDPSVNIHIDEMPIGATSTISPANSEFIEALKKVSPKWDPAAIVTPGILLSSTDSVLFRAIGIKTYGFEPYRLTAEEISRAHGNDERLSIDNVIFGIAFQTDFLQELCGKKD